MPSPETALYRYPAPAPAPAPGPQTPNLDLPPPIIARREAQNGSLVLSNKGTRMESEPSEEYTTLESEITKGMEQVKQLKASSSGNKEKLLERMLASYEEALVILNDVASEGQGLSFKSPPSDTPGSSKRASNRRAIWATKIRVTSDCVGQPDDGYCWRKYGQKEVLGCKYPRGYYRCTNRQQGCLATKQVQRSTDDPCVFEITYRGKHTCRISGP